ncbi:MAG: hypothetical protein K0U72_16205 [Gammaproteobacteria bacterium]|nr:hypothetical protein [Gammaproteobacteria bacterium]
MIRITLMCCLLGLSHSWAQESDAGDAPEETQVEVPELEEDDEEFVEDELLDDPELYSREGEDDFIPTDEVRFEQSIPYPTDI